MCHRSIAPNQGGGRQLLLTGEMSLKADPWKSDCAALCEEVGCKQAAASQVRPRGCACRSAARHLWAQGGNSNVAAAKFSNEQMLMRADFQDCLFQIPLNTETLGGSTSKVLERKTSFKLQRAGVEIWKCMWNAARCSITACTRHGC